MRWAFGALIACVMAVVASAAPVPGLSVAKPVPSRLKFDAEVFAAQLLKVINTVENQYTRKIDRHDLLTAALAGLHDTARVPLPAALLRELGDTTTDEQALAVIQRAREDLGMIPELAGYAPLLAACRGIALKLDRHSSVVTGADFRRGLGVDEQTGLGLEIDEEKVQGGYRISRVFPGGPAQVAGIRPGDRITQIKDWRLEEKGLRKVEDWLVRILFDPNGNKQPQGADWAASPPPDLEPLPLTVRRGESELTFKLEAKTFQPETVLGTIRLADNSWTYWLDPKRKIAHVRIAGFGNTTALDLRTALDDLSKEGLRGLILDLRNCPGGYLKQAIQTAGLFLPKDVVIGTATGRVDGDTVYKNEAPRSYTDFPMVVLIDGETTGGAEMIAAALQDHKRAMIAGTRTAGKGNVQIHLPLGDDAGFKLTTRTLLRPSKKPMHLFPDSSVHDDWGVRPDEGLELRVSPDLNKQLKEWWLLQTLRPGGCKERLPLDDPEVDTQRYAALEELLKLEAEKPRRER